MSYGVTILVGLVVLIVLGFLVNLIWRLASQRQELPCPSWLGWMVELDNPFTRVNHAQFIVDHLGLEPGMKALDAGCGPAASRCRWLPPASPWRYVSLLPLVGMVADYFENGLVLLMLGPYPEQLNTVTTMASAATMIKWGSNYVDYTLMVVGLVGVATQAIAKRRAR